MSPPDFTLETFQNEYLPVGGREVNAILTVTSAVAAGPGTAPADAAEIVIIDCSGSMGGSKIVEAKQATAVALDAIRDGVAFAVVEGTGTAAEVYPGHGRLATASRGTIQEAKRAVRRLEAHDGTAIGTWLRLARQIFGTGRATLRHAILLTDGHNGEGGGKLEEAIGLCEGVFTCDCRGVGTGWNPSELRKIATALLGSLDIVPEPSGLAADFGAMMTAAMGKEVADVLLRVRTPQHARVRFVKQTAPVADDLTGRRVDAGPQADDYPTGAWGQESRDYHLCVEIESAPVGEEMLAARVSLVRSSPSGSEVLGQGLIKARWTEDEELSTRINDRVAHALGQTELAEVIQVGLAARKAGDQETATAKLGRAVALAHESGNEDTARLLAKVVDVVDPVTGTVRLKTRVSDVDEMTLDVRSSKTVRVRKDPDGSQPGG
jgi:von Willebrand factor type A C-terminal domain/von Willebrand factor type A domain